MTAAVSAGDLLSWAVLAGGGAVVVCVLVLMVAFRMRKPGIFMKRPNGRLSGLSWILFWPYYAYNYLVFNVWRLTSKEMPFNEIIPGLFLGRRLCRGEQHLVQSLGEMAVLDLTAEFAEPAFMRRQAAYLCLPTLDMTAPTRNTLERSLEFIREHLGQRPVYVHCALGHGRSAVIVLAHLLASGQFDSVGAARDYVKAQRWGVSLTNSQRTRLLEIVRRRAGV